MDTEPSDEHLMDELAKLPPKAQEHFKMVVRLVAQCYVNTDDYNGLLIVKDGEHTVLMSLNANDMDAAELVIEASEFISRVVTSDAPPREKFN